MQVLLHWIQLAELIHRFLYWGRTLLSLLGKLWQVVPASASSAFALSKDIRKSASKIARGVLRSFCIWIKQPIYAWRFRLMKHWSLDSIEMQIPSSGYLWAWNLLQGSICDMCHPRDILPRAHPMPNSMTSVPEPSESEIVDEIHLHSSQHFKSNEKGYLKFR